MSKKLSGWFLVVLGIFLNSGSGSTSHVMAVNRNNQQFLSQASQQNSSAISCNTELSVGEEYACVVSSTDENTKFSLKDAPIGMMIQPLTGFLHWTPAENQSGSYEVIIIRKINGERDETPVTFNVKTSAVTAPAGIYIAPNGTDGATGTIEDPLLFLHEAASVAEPGDTIFLRGGTYFNDGFGNESFIDRRNNFARITRSGNKNNPITIRPHGNEYVKLKSDVNGIVFKDTAYWRVQGIELEGTTRQLDHNTVLSLWWDDTEASNKITGRGIAMNGSFHIEISDCIIREFPGAGVSNNGGANISLSDSIIYNNAWWSTAGTHGFANSKPETETENNRSSFKMTMSGNLVFGNQSSMISHVFSKGFVKLEIDEGNGLHMQNTEGLFFGAFLAENNLLIYNGKAGLGLNTIANSTIRNNSFYKNAQAVHSSAELSLKSPENNTQPNKIEKNLFHALGDRQTIKLLNSNQDNPYEGISDNYGVPAQDADAFADNNIITLVENVFTDPKKFDFSPVSSISSDYGVPLAILDNFKSKLREYGIKIKPAKTKVTEEYLRELKLKIFRNWTPPNPDDSIPDGLFLEDGKTGFCYTYEQRNVYPAPPRTITPSCPKQFAD